MGIAQQENSVVRFLFFVAFWKAVRLICCEMIRPGEARGMCHKNGKKEGKYGLMKTV